MAYFLTQINIYKHRFFINLCSTAKLSSFEQTGVYNFKESPDSSFMYGLYRFEGNFSVPPLRPFLYRSYIVLISFLYKNIRTI